MIDMPPPTTAPRSTSVTDTQLLDSIGSGLLVVEAVRNGAGVIIDTTVLRTTAALQRWLPDAAKAVGQSYATLLPFANSTGWLECITTVIASGRTISKEWHYKAVDQFYLLSLTPLATDQVVITFIEQTVARQQKEAEIQQVQDRFRVIFDTAQAGMYTLTPERDEQGNIYDFRFGIVNKAVAGYLGLTPELLAGSLGSTYFPAYMTNGLFDRYIETLRTGESSTFDLHYADGYDNYFTISIVSIGEELFGTFTDHSTLKRLQKELESSIAELRRSNSSLEQFAHAASHDLKEPLRKISLYSDRLEVNHGAELSDAAFSCVERIQTASKRMQRLINDLLVFAEVGANRPDMEDVPLNTLLQEVLNDLEVAITESDAVVTIGELGTIKGDSLHLQQLFQNLIGNSIKYSRPGVPPHVSITATVIEGTKAAFPLSEYDAAKTYWQLQLQDNGQGFTPEQATQIFQIFQRLPQHRTEYSGTGIGLAIVQRVVENHKGFIKAEGVPGEGATFTILLPVRS